MHRIKLITKIGGKTLPRLGGNGKIPGGIPHQRQHHDDELDRKSVNRLFTCGTSLTMHLVQNHSDQLG